MGHLLRTRAPRGLGWIAAILLVAASVSGCIMIDKSPEASSGGLVCEDGGCDFECRHREHCDVQCPGGHCDVDCGDAELCTVGCAEGYCNVYCNDADQCQVHCNGGNCDMHW